MAKGKVSPDTLSEALLVRMGYCINLGREQTIRGKFKLDVGQKLGLKWRQDGMPTADMHGGFVDICAANLEGKVVGIQATGWTNVSSRLAKILEHPDFPDWPFDISIWGWKTVPMASGHFMMRKINVRTQEEGKEAIWLCKHDLLELC